MSTNLPPAGWHPDPENPTGAVRWWDGSKWTANVQPISPGPGGSYGYGAQGPGRPDWGGGQPWTGASVPAEATFSRRNQASLTAMGVGLLYLLVDLTTHFFLIGIVPIFLAVRAVQHKEQLAPLAVVVAVLVVAMTVIVS